MKCAERIIVGTLVMAMTLGVSNRLTNAQAEGELLGEIKKVQGAAGEIIVGTTGTADNIKANDLLYVRVDGQVVKLRAKFPMQTIVKCRAEGPNRALASRINAGDKVYRYSAAVDGGAVTKVNAADTRKQPSIEYKIGDAGPAGGIIFYDKGSSSDGWRYLEVAPEDQSHRVRWNWEKDDDLATGAKAAGPGSGKENTAKIVAAYGEGAYAAKLCADYRGGGKSDWYLPSIEELDLIYENLKKPGLVKFNGRFCWSSTEYDDDEAIFLTFGFGYKNEEKKRGEGRVRAVRRF